MKHFLPLHLDWSGWDLRSQTAGRVCGIVLLFASYQIIHMRREYRKARDVSSNYDVE